MNNNRIYYSQEAQQQAQREKLMMVMLVTGLSVSIGTLIALLFAPQSGNETRHQVGEQFDSVLSKARNVADTAMTRAREDTENLRDTVKDQLQSVTG